jgi:hypothetical protein
MLDKFRKIRSLLSAFHKTAFMSLVTLGIAIDGAAPLFECLVMKSQAACLIWKTSKTSLMILLILLPLLVAYLFAAEKAQLKLQDTKKKTT